MWFSDNGKVGGIQISKTKIRVFSQHMGNRSTYQQIMPDQHAKSVWQFHPRFHPLNSPQIHSVALNLFVGLFMLGSTFFLPYHHGSFGEVSCRSQFGSCGRQYCTTFGDAEREAEGQQLIKKLISRWYAWFFFSPVITIGIIWGYTWLYHVIPLIAEL